MDDPAAVEEQIIKGEDIRQLVCFKFADEEYAVDITHVREVIRAQRITPVPQMPDFTLGIINMRGDIIPVFDLRKKFILPEKECDDKTKMLITDATGTHICFLVDEIMDNVKISAGVIDPSPAVKMKIKRECITGIGQFDDRMIIILDLKKLNSDIEEDIEAAGNKGTAAEV